MALTYESSWQPLHQARPITSLNASFACSFPQVRVREADLCARWARARRAGRLRGGCQPPASMHW